MSMTVVVTRNVPDRFRGFLASAMLEIAPGVYTSSQLSAGVRERLWAVLEGWFVGLPESSIVMVWRDSSVPAGQSLRVLGVPPIDLVELDGIILARKRARADEP
jgi:CRISPR-associated protein Cas2